MMYGYPWELQSWAIALYMSNALDGVGRFRNISLPVVFFTETAFDVF
jgi:hypothetical protein